MPRLTAWPGRNTSYNCEACFQTRNAVAMQLRWTKKQKKRSGAQCRIHSGGSEAEFNLSTGGPYACPRPFMSPVLSVVDLHKLYGETVAVDGISFEVRRNE